MPLPDLAHYRRHNADFIAHCIQCGHKAVLNRERLIDRLGPKFVVRNLSTRLRCSKCGARSIEAQVLWPDLVARRYFLTREGIDDA